MAKRGSGASKDKSPRSVGRIRAKHRGAGDDLDAQSKGLAHDAGQVHKWLKGILENSAASRGVYTFKDRVKPWYEIRDKVLGKRNHENADLRKPDYRVRDVTDASGFRIVCLFNAEIPSALEKLFALLKAPAASNGRFAAKPIREILFFSSRRAGDPLSVLSQIEAVVDQHEHSAHFKVPSAVDEEGHTSSYSSVHVIVESEVGDGTNCVRSCSEIQLRSVFEEAWGEINHRLKYAPAKRERALGTQGPSEDKAPSQLFLHLDALKSLTDGCAQYADLINTQILQSRPGEASRKPRSIDPVGMALEPFEACEASVKQLVSNALKLRQKAEDCPTGDKKGAAFVAASQAFGRAAAALAKSKRPAEREWLLELLTEERAYCEMFSGNAELLTRAEMTYRDLLRTNHSPSALLRLGQIRRDANDLVEARELMEEGLTAAAADKSGLHANTTWLLQRDLAYIYWRIVDLEPKHPEGLRLLDRAVELTEMALKDAEQPARELNASLNLLYFLIDLAARSEGDRRKKAHKQAKPLLERLRSHPDIERWNIEKLDTMLRAERDIGNIAEARKHAETILQELEARLAAFAAGGTQLVNAFSQLSHDERDMYLCAQTVLAKSRGDKAKSR